MKRIFLFTLAALVVSCCGAIIGSTITLRFYRDFAHTEQVVITKRLEIVDDQGKTRATFGVNRDDMMLQMLSLAGRPMISLGILAQTKSRQSELDKAGVRGIYYPAPLFELDNERGKSAIRMTTVHNGYGQVNFASDQSSGKLILGYYAPGDVDDGVHDQGAWGLAIHSQQGGTGIGIMNTDGIDGPYIVPHPFTGWK